MRKFSEGTAFLLGDENLGRGSLGLQLSRLPLGFTKSPVRAYIIQVFVLDDSMARLQGLLLPFFL
jgi:hypothetical protein